MNELELIKAKEVAKILGYSVAHVYKLYKQEKIPGIEIKGTGAKRFNKEAILNLLKEKEVQQCQLSPNNTSTT